MTSSWRSWLKRVTRPQGVAARSASRKPLSLECLEDRAVPAITLPTAGTPAAATLTGTAGNDSFLIRLQAGNTSRIEFSQNGATPVSAALTDVQNIAIQGGGGKDTVTIDNSNGLVGQAPT